VFVNDFYYIVLAFLVTCGDGYQAEVSSSSLFHSQNNHFCDGTSLPVANHPCQPQSQPGRREANLIMKWRPFVHMAANSQPSKHASSFRRVYLQKGANSEVSRIKHSYRFNFKLNVRKFVEAFYSSYASNEQSSV